MMILIISGREFEITIRGKGGTSLANPLPGIPGNFTSTQTISSSQNGADAQNGASVATNRSGRDAGNSTSLQRGNSGWNVWNDTASINSDNRDANSIAGATMTLRAADSQVRN